MKAPILNLNRENEVLVSFWNNDELHEIPMSAIPGISYAISECSNAAITIIDKYCFCFVTVVGEGQGGILLVYNCEERIVQDTINAEYAKNGYVLKSTDTYYVILSHGISHYGANHLATSIISFNPQSASFTEIEFEKQDWKNKSSEHNIVFDTEKGIFNITNEGDDEVIEFKLIAKKLAEIESNSPIVDGRPFWAFPKTDDCSYEYEDWYDESEIDDVDWKELPDGIEFKANRKNEIIATWEYDYQKHQESFDKRAKAIYKVCNFVSLESYKEEPLYQVKKVIDLLTKNKFIKYYVFAEKVGLAVIDTSYRKYPVIVEKIKIILGLTKDELKKEFYYLVNKDGKITVSNEKGSLGGHHKLKIYGKLDCPSANRYVNKEQYVQHRVFFKNEITAIAAGYRPCGVCMPDAYKKWKESHK